MREIILNVIQNIIEDKKDNHTIPAVATWTDIRTILNREYPDSLVKKTIWEMVVSKELVWYNTINDTAFLIKKAIYKKPEILAQSTAINRECHLGLKPDKQ